MGGRGQMNCAYQRAGSAIGVDHRMNLRVEERCVRRPSRQTPFLKFLSSFSRYVPKGDSPQLTWFSGYSSCPVLLPTPLCVQLACVPSAQLTGPSRDRGEVRNVSVDLAARHWHQKPFSIIACQASLPLSQRMVIKSHNHTIRDEPDRRGRWTSLQRTCTECHINYNRETKTQVTSITPRPAHIPVNLGPRAPTLPCVTR